MGRKSEFLLGILRSNRLRFPLALAAGVLIWLCSLPPHGLMVFSIVAFIPVLAALPGEAPGRVAAWGWMGGAAWEFATLWWLIPTIVNYGDIRTPAAIALIIGMCLVLGLYMAGFLSTMALLMKFRGRGALLLAAPAWVLWEWLRGVLFTGFPWWGPGYGLSVNPGLLQLTRLAGVLGLSFLALLTASAVALWITDRKHSLNKVGVPLALVLLTAAFVWGYLKNAEPMKQIPQIRVAYVQPQIPQDKKWSRDFAEKIMERFERLTSAFKHYKLKLVVWPESSTPFEWDANAAFRMRVTTLAAEVKAPILLGSVVSGEGGIENAALLVMPDGSTGGKYAKTHLVPFGEYIPLRRLLTFAKPLVEAVGEMKPGTGFEPLQTPAGRVGVTICYEGIFPGIVRRQVAHGAQILVNMTNDAWYRGTPGPIEHFLIERVRAVETDRYLVRSANYGVSGIVTPRGAVEAATTPGEPASYWGLVEARDTITPWTRFGNRWLIVLLTIIIAAFIPWKGKASTLRAEEE